MVASSPRHRLAAHQIIAGVTGPGALALLTLAWIVAPPQLELSQLLRDETLGVLLVAALVASYRFPIHLRVKSKLYVGTAVLFLMAALLPAPVAAIAAALGTLAGELTARHRTGNYYSEMVTHAARWMILCLLASFIAHISVSDATLLPLPLMAAAAGLWVADPVTALLVAVPLTGERPRRLLGSLYRDAGVAEAGQYVLGVLAALIAIHQVWMLGAFLLPVGLVYTACKTSKEMHDQTRELLERMADTVDLRDPYTGGHSRRVTEYTTGILRELGLHGPEVDLIVTAARVHDIGKIGIPDAILNKPGKLSGEEWASMQSHSEQGADLLERYHDFTRGSAIVRHHHESWDGTGYPHRLTGTDIPFGARVIAIADSYDAMTSDRPYRAGMTPDMAARILREGRGVQWDATIVDAFLRSIATQLELPHQPGLRLVVPERLATGA